MIPSFAATLKACPFLTTIRSDSSGGHTDLDYFDQLDRMETIDESCVGYIRSFRYGEEEILHVRLLWSYTEVKDAFWNPALPISQGFGESTDRNRHERIRYTTVDGIERYKMFEKIEEPMWTDFTDWGGKRISLRHFDHMRRIQGATVEEWEGRNVMLTDAAWKYLVDDREATLLARR